VRKFHRHNLNPIAALVFVVTLCAAPLRAEVKLFAEQPLRFSLIPAEPLSKEIDGQVKEALELLISYPSSSRHVRLLHDEYQVEQYDHYDFIIELTTQKNILREIEFIQQTGGLVMSSGFAGTMVVANQKKGPFIVYVVLDELLQGRAWGRDRLTNDALAKLSTMLAQEIFGHVLSLKSKLRMMSSAAKPAGEPFELNPEEEQAMRQTAMREAIAFINRVLLSNRPSITLDVRRSFSEFSRILSERLAARVAHAASQQTSSNVVTVDFKTKCRQLLKAE